MGVITRPVDIKLRLGENIGADKISDLIYKTVEELFRPAVCYDRGEGRCKISSNALRHGLSLANDLVQIEPQAFEELSQCFFGRLISVVRRRRQDARDRGLSNAGSVVQMLLVEASAIHGWLQARDCVSPLFLREWVHGALRSDAA